MKRILMVAPGVHPPWTEGRRNFVRDLFLAMPNRGIAPVLVSGSQAITTADRQELLQSETRTRLVAHLIDTLAMTKKTLRSGRFQAVLVFPYGRFSGIRGFVNRWFAKKALRLCAAGVDKPHMLLYSCAGMSLQQAVRSFGPLIAVGSGEQNVASVPLGIEHPPRQWSYTRTKQLLFMAGYQPTTDKALDGVLEERGLMDLLQAGPGIAGLGYRLTIAIPFLKHDGMRAKLAAKIARHAGNLAVDMRTTIDWADAVDDHDAFMFPYRVPHAVFIPTSMLEAMSLGMPVIASDQPMYRSLTQDAEETRCLLHEPRRAESIVAALSEFDLDAARCIRLAEGARTWVRQEWTLERCIDSILECLDLPAS